MFEKGSIVLYNRKPYVILRLYFSTGRVELRGEEGKVVYLSPYFMQRFRQ